MRGADYLGVDTSTRERLVTTIRSYLVPRIENPDAPFLVAVVGPTGSGKSTLVNSLSGLDLATAGPVRPTTTTPLILTATSGPVEVGGIECRVATGAAPILGHMSFVDTPDLDSTSTHHRVIAETIVDHADVVIFVTSALRYADNVPWEVLRRAKYRGAVVLPVINRVGPESGAAVHDYRRRLGDSGLDDDPVRVPEHFVGAGNARIHSLAVRDLRRRLYWVARDRAQHQAAVVNRVLNSTTEQIRQLMSTVTGVAVDLDVIESELTAGLIGESSLSARRRPWAAFPLPSVPDRSSKVKRWLRRSQPTDAAFDTWQDSVRAGIVAEAETRLLTAIAVYAAPVTALNPKAARAVTSDARTVLEKAVDGWMEGVASQNVKASHSRLASAISISAALTSVDARITASVLGPDHVRLVTATREELNAGLATVFAHIADRLVELWRHSVGDPAVDDLAARLADVAAAYQFANA